MKKLFLSIIALAHFGAQAQWTNVPGARLTNISCGSASLVAGCDATGFGWHLNTGTDAWVQEPINQSVSKVAMCADGSLFYIGTTNNVNRVLNFSGAFTGVYTGGQVVNVSARNANYALGALTGATGANIYSYNGSSWALLAGGGNLDKVAVGDDGTTYGIYANNGSVYSHNGSSWAVQSGTLSHVAVANASMIVGISTSGNLMARVGTTFSVTDLPRPNGADIIDVDIAADGTIYALTNENFYNVYRTTWDDLYNPGCQPLASGTAISGPSQVCAGQTATFTAAPVTNATSYTWTMANGWTGSSTTNTIVITAPTTNIQSQLTVTANNDCFTGAPASWNATVMFPPEPLAISGPVTGCVGVAASYTATPNTGGITWSYPNGWSTNSVYPGQNGGVFSQGDAGYVVFSKANACFERSDSVYVNVYQDVPTAPVYVTGQEQLCIGDNVFFAFSVDSTAASSVFVTPQFVTGWVVQSDTDTSRYLTAQGAGGQYPLTLTASNNCGNTSTAVALTSNRYPLSYSGYIQQSGDILYANTWTPGNIYYEDVNYQWMLDGTVIPGANSVAYTPLVTGNYTVEVSFVDFPCGTYTSESEYVEVAITVGVNEAATSNMSIYPNPFNTEFVIETTELTSISVMNAMGEVVLSRTINGRASIDATTLSAGIYFVREETSGVVMKLVKN